MAPTMMWRTLVTFLLSLTYAVQVSAQTPSSASISTPAAASSSGGASSVPAGGSGASPTSGPAPDVYLNVPELSVGRIELGESRMEIDEHTDG